MFENLIILKNFKIELNYSFKFSSFFLEKNIRLRFPNHIIIIIKLNNFTLWILVDFNPDEYLNETVTYFQVTITKISSHWGSLTPNFLFHFCLF